MYLSNLSPIYLCLCSGSMFTKKSSDYSLCCSIGLSTEKESTGSDGPSIIISSVIVVLIEKKLIGIWIPFSSFVSLCNMGLLLREEVALTCLGQKEFFFLCNSLCPSSTGLVRTKGDEA